MIKADKDLVQLHGDTVDLLVELALTVRGLYEAIKIKDGSAAAEAKIRSAIALGLAAEEETEKPATNPITVPNKELKSVLIDLINKVFGEDKKDE